MTIDKERIQYLFDEYFERERLYIDAMNEQKNFDQQVIRPGYPEAFSSLNDYENWEKGWKDWKRRAEQYKAISLDALASLQSIERELVTAIPHAVWFKTGDMGIGIDYDGKKFSVSTWEWCDDMPKLGRTRTNS
jgi:hypothetical protein